jgi:hypothetical protein
VGRAEWTAGVPHVLPLRDRSACTSGMECCSMSDVYVAALGIVVFGLM